jgi:hypothetical protein
MSEVKLAMRLIALNLTLVLALSLWLASPPEKASAAGIQVSNQTAANKFPDGINFAVSITSDADISDVRFHFHILPDGVEAQLRPQCSTGRTVTCTATLGNSLDSYIVPGAKVDYSWEISDASGAHLQTDEQTTTYNDTRFQWQSITDKNVTVNYYSGDSATQQQVLQLVEQTLDRIGKVEGVTVDFPIKVWIYRTAQEMAAAAAPHIGTGSQGSIITLGEVAASDTALISSDTDYLDIVRHELAHIVTGAATRKYQYLSPIPVWINEGISVYSQNQMLPDEQQALKLAIQRNRILPITSLDASARSTADVVSLFYSESGSIISFLVNQYGDDKFAQFIAALAKDTTDGALQSVYAFDQVGLENAWRKSVGLPEITLSSNSGANPQTIPTLVPFGSQPNATAIPTKAASSQLNPTATTRASSSSASKHSGSSNSSLLTIAAVLVAVVLILLLVAAGVYLQRRRSST